MQPGDRLDAVRRLTWFSAALLIWAGLIFAKLLSLQVFHHELYLERAQKQQEHLIELSAPRGTIVDRNGEPLAMSVPVESIAVNPRLIPDRAFVAELLAPVLSLDPAQIREAMDDAVAHHRGYLYIKRRISREESDRLHAMNADWMIFEQESKRIYPGDRLAAHVVGSVYQGEKGAEGIERANDSLLKGTPGKAELLTDVKRRGIESWVKVPPTPGETLKLTIDARLQFVVERELAAQVALKHGRTGTAIIMNPYTGEILAMGSVPTFDPNTPPRNSEERRAHFNLGAQVPFEPGSIFKVLTLSTALETTNLRPESLINCHNGALALPGRVVHEAHGGFGTLTMAQVLAKSSNIGAIEIGSRIGREKFYEYLTNFGFGQRTGLPLPAESHGILRTLDKWGTTSLASVSIGQEVGATSLQLIRACAAVANGGLLVKPRLVLEADGKPTGMETPKRVLRPETTVTMRSLMEGVVLFGTGRHFIKLDGWSAGGKTGTAQIFEHGHYSHFYNASFMGFAPVSKPALVAIVTINGTEGNAGMGGPTAGPVWTRIMNEALRLYDVPKDLPVDVKPEQAAPAKPQDYVEVASIEGEPDRSVLEEDPSAMPTLNDVAPAESPDTPALVAKASSPVAPADAPKPAAPGGPVMPDFAGKTMRAVVSEAYAMGLLIHSEGSGVARLQAPAAGTPLHAGETVRVLFGR